MTVSMTILVVLLAIIGIPLVLSLILVLLR
jgi:hypothetical protein